MAYQIQVASLVDRTNSIAAAVAGTAATERFLFRHRQEDLPLVRLPIGLPIYRMENFRTRVKQSEYLRKNEVSAEFFHDGQESEAAQQAQHEILVDMAKRGRGTSVIPIFSVLRASVQTDRLLITSTGVVVNGNRRLAAMRELVAGEDAATYDRYQYVDCLVLPSDARPEELREVEVRLQMTPETRLPYDWVCECLAIREFESEGKSHGEIASMMNQSKPTIARKAAALDHAEIYLEEWIEQPKEYSLIERGEQIFWEMSKALERRAGGELEVGRAMGYFIFENVADIEDRAYEYRNAFGRDLDKVVATAASRLGVNIASTGEAQAANGDDLVVDIETPESPDRTVDLKRFVPVLKDRTDVKRVLDEIKSACQEISDAANEDKAGTRALLTLKSVLRSLTQVDLASAHPTTRGEIESVLEELRTASAALLEGVRSLGNNNR